MPLQVVSPNSQTATTEAFEKYFKIQVRAWTAFDPRDMDLDAIAARIQQGEGVVTAVDIARIADKLEAIDDDQVRLQFQVLIVIEHIIRNAASLPSAVRTRLIEAVAEIPREHQPVQHHSKAMPAVEQRLP